MTREEAKQWIENLIKTMRIETSGSYPDSAYKDEVYVALNMAIKALEQQLSDDCISRQAVIDTTLNSKQSFINDFACGFFIDKIRDLPPVTPKEKTDWTPVSERPPEEFESVLVCYESQGGMAQAVSERFGYRWSALAGIEPIAWMPLPTSFEPQESENKE